MELFQDKKYEELIDSVKTYYQQPHRVFHDWLHIHNGVLAAQKLGGEFDWNMSQQLAWLFHDIVYIPGIAHNEKNSVHMMNVVLNMFKREGIDFGLDSYISTASTIIYSTSVHTPVNDLCKPVLDIDMICFSSQKLLRKANQEIIQEFNLRDFGGRIKFLEDLNGRQIYHTNYAFEHWEQKAHRNITASIASLRKGVL